MTAVRCVVFYGINLKNSFQPPTKWAKLMGVQIYIYIYLNTTPLQNSLIKAKETLGKRIKLKTIELKTRTRSKTSTYLLFKKKTRKNSYANMCKRMRNKLFVLA